jgi:molybdenum cofactor cytidylyltransferase
MPMPVAAIVLAAGGSRRLGQPKQLLLLNGETLVARALRVACEAGAAPVLTVLGAQHDHISNSIGASGAVVVINEDWQQGVSTSISAGIRAVAEYDPAPQGVLLLGCDQPRLDVNHLRELIRVFHAQNSEAIVSSSYAGIQGIPAIFPRVAFSGLLALRGDKGARALIASPPCAMVAVPFEGGEIDIDLPQDLAQIG